MLTPRDCLEKVSYMLAVNGFNVVDLTPRKHEYNASNYSKPDIYKSPIEFTVNGTPVWLYGNTLMINGDRSKASPFSIVDAYKAIIGVAKRGKKLPPELSPVRTVASIIAKYIASVTLEAKSAA